jgi:hypothetical protein
MRFAGGILWRILAPLFLLICCGQAHAAGVPEPAEAAGKIDLVTGELQILQAGRPARAGHAGDPIFEGDILATGKDSETHITMLDSGFIALRANTRMQVFSYKADGGDQDQGVFKVFSGAMRSISGWIGKYNRRSYLVRTPTATIGIRGTDHETRYIPAGSDEGEAGTYDKVFIGETTIQSDSGQTTVDPNQAGYAANEGEAQPKVLSSVPAFFRPGPHEDLINQKHAEIQKMIVERREERRKIVEQKRAEFQAAQHGLKQQAAANKAAGEARMAANEAQKQSIGQQAAALRARGEALQKSGAALQEKRKALMQQLTPVLRRDADLRRQFQAVWETGKSIGQEYQAISEGRAAIADRVTKANEARTAAADEQRKQAEARLAELTATAEAMKQKWADLAAAREAMEKERATLAPAELGRRNKELNTRNDALQEEQKQLAAGYDTLFYSNIGASQSRIEEARAQRMQNAEQNAAFNDREDAVQERQRINEDKLEALQAQAIERLGGDEKLSAQLREVHDTVQANRAERADLTVARRAMQAANLAATEQRQNEALQDIERVRAKHREMENRRSDLQNEQKAMQEEMRSLYEQEQKRYSEELRIDRESAAQNPY